VDSLGDLGRHIVEYAFGDAYTRPSRALAPRPRAGHRGHARRQGRCEAQLDVRLRAQRRLTVDELREVLIQVAPYAGFAGAIDAMLRLQALEAEEAGQ
jgi:4-carboxymuconolactone decarboxylase